MSIKKTTATQALNKILRHGEKNAKRSQNTTYFPHKIYQEHIPLDIGKYSSNLRMMG